MKRIILLVGMLACSAAALDAQKIIKLKVRILSSQTTQGTGVYTVPGYASTSCSLSAYGSEAYGRCFGLSTPSQPFSVPIQGATFSLLLPDGRVVVVTCDKKLNWTDWSTTSPYRSCRVPLVADLDAEFYRDQAKLKWNVSIDGSKMENETYKIIALLAKIPDKD